MGYAGRKAASLSPGFASSRSETPPRVLRPAKDSAPRRRPGRGVGGGKGGRRSVPRHGPGFPRKISRRDRRLEAVAKDPVTPLNHFACRGTLRFRFFNSGRLSLASRFAGRAEVFRPRHKCCTFSRPRWPPPLSSRRGGGEGVFGTPFRGRGDRRPPPPPPGRRRGAESLAGRSTRGGVSERDEANPGLSEAAFRPAYPTRRQR